MFFPVNKKYGQAAPGIFGSFAAVVHLQHERLGPLPIEPEVLAKHVRDVRHEVHGVVPHDGDPGLRRAQSVLVF